MRLETRNAHRATGERLLQTQTRHAKPVNSSVKRSVFNRIRLTCACADCAIDATQGRFVCRTCGATLATAADAVNAVTLDVCEAEYLRDDAGAEVDE
jgi:hypothetical protein